MGRWRRPQAGDGGVPPRQRRPISPDPSTTRFAGGPPPRASSGRISLPPFTLVADVRRPAALPLRGLAAPLAVRVRPRPPRLDRRAVGVERLELERAGQRVGLAELELERVADRIARRGVLADQRPPGFV